MTSELVVRGGALAGGEVAAPSYKHAIVPVMCAAIGLGAKVTIANAPRIADVAVLAECVRRLGGEASRGGDAEADLTLDTRPLAYAELPASLAAAVHGTQYLAPVLLGRFGEVRLGVTGGCQLGRPDGRPVAHVREVLTRFGAQLDPVALAGTVRGGLRACTIDIFDFSERTDVLTGPHVSGATKTSLLAAALVERGTTTIRHPYPKADVGELALFLQHQGIDVEVSADAIVVRAGMRRPPATTPVTIVADISEVVTYVAAAAFHRFPIRVRGTMGDRLSRALAPELALFEAMGVTPSIDEHAVTLDGRTQGPLTSRDIEVTSVGIYSDHQPFFALLGLCARGPSTIREHVWKSRFAYANELAAMGATLAVAGDTLHITPSSLHAPTRVLHGADVRGAAVLAVAALGLAGETVISGAEHLERGYDDLPRKLRALGGDVELRA